MFSLKYVQGEVITDRSRFSNAYSGLNDQYAVQMVIPKVAILELEVESGNAITLSVYDSTEAGAPDGFTEAVENSAWINYTSIIGSGSEPTHAISARITSGLVPRGMKLSVLAANVFGSEDGIL